MFKQPKDRFGIVPKQKDVVIIGAGYGGLLCGAMLARQGLKVLLIDSSDIIGQPGGSYPYNGYWLDWGNRDAVGMRDPFLATSKYDLIAAERAGAKITLKHLHPVMLVHDSLNKGKPVPASFDNPEQVTPFLRDVFGIPDNQQHHFFQLLESMGKESPERVRMLINVKFREWLPTLDVPETVKNGLQVLQNMMAQYAPEETSVGRFIESFVQLPPQTYRADDEEVGGAQGFNEPYARVIRGQGGEFWLNTKPVRILVENGQVTGVAALDPYAFIREVKTTQVIFTHPAYSVFELIEDYEFPADFVQKAWSVKPLEVASINVQVGLSDIPTRSSDGKKENHIGWNRLLHGPEKSYGGGWLISSLTSKKQAPPGKHMMWAHYSGRGGYAYLKNMMGKLVDYLHFYYSNLDEVTEWAKPQWFNGPGMPSWTYKTGERVPMKSPLPGLYMQGFTVDIQGAFYDAEAHSAIEVVDMILPHQ
jgi:phytoene dehydrogenase-like protein